MHDIIIIGSGLGGLASGAILARRGMSVCVLEQHTQAGGCLQSFRRGGATFDTGFHCVGGLRPGEVLHPYFRHLRLLDLPWVQMDEACFEEIHIGDDVYAFAQGRERFIETLAERFPTERAGLEAFMDMLESTGHSLAHLFDDADTARAHTRERFGQSAYDFLQRTITDPRLRSVLSGASMKMELHADALPLYTFAQINNSYIQSAWRLRGGGEPIVRRLVEQIEQAGGTVRTRARVARLIAADGRLTAAELSDGERVEGRTFISDIHPALTVGLIPSDSGLLRRVYRQRIESLKNTFGFFTLHVHAPHTPIPYLNRNVSIYDGYESLWHNNRSEANKQLLEQGRLPRLSYLLPSAGHTRLAHRHHARRPAPHHAPHQQPPRLGHQALCAKSQIHRLEVRIGGAMRAETPRTRRPPARLYHRARDHLHAPDLPSLHGHAPRLGLRHPP